MTIQKLIYLLNDESACSKISPKVVSNTPQTKFLKKKKKIVSDKYSIDSQLSLVWNAEHFDKNCDYYNTKLTAFEEKKL